MSWFKGIWRRSPKPMHCYCGAVVPPGQWHRCKTPGELRGEITAAERKLNEVPHRDFSQPDGQVCIGGWIYSAVGGMIFPTNRECPGCEDCKKTSP